MEDILNESLDLLRPIRRRTRWALMLLDHVIMCCIVSIIYIPFFMTFLFMGMDHGSGSGGLMGWLMLVMIVAMSFYLNKDVIGGRSPAKRIMKFRVVNNGDGEAAHPIRCLVRNIFCIVWPVEVIVSLFNTSRRIGDVVAGTKLVRYDPSGNKDAVNVTWVILSLIAGVVFMYGFYWVMDIWFGTEFVAYPPLSGMD